MIQAPPLRERQAPWHRGFSAGFECVPAGSNRAAAAARTRSAGSGRERMGTVNLGNFTCPPGVSGTWPARRPALDYRSGRAEARAMRHRRHPRTLARPAVILVIGLALGLLVAMQIVAMIREARVLGTFGAPA